MLILCLILFFSFIVNIITIISYRKQVKELQEVAFLFKNEIVELKKDLKKERAINYQLMRHSD